MDLLRSSEHAPETQPYVGSGTSAQGGICTRVYQYFMTFLFRHLRQYQRFDPDSHHGQVASSREPQILALALLYPNIPHAAVIAGITEGYLCMYFGTLPENYSTGFDNEKSRLIWGAARAAAWPELPLLPGLNIADPFVQGFRGTDELRGHTCVKCNNDFKGHAMKPARTRNPLEGVPCATCYGHTSEDTASELEGFKNAIDFVRRIEQLVLVYIVRPRNPMSMSTMKDTGSIEFSQPCTDVDQQIAVVSAPVGSQVPLFKGILFGGYSARDDVRIFSGAPATYLRISKMSPD